MGTAGQAVTRPGAHVHLAEHPAARGNLGLSRLELRPPPDRTYPGCPGFGLSPHPYTGARDGN